MTLYQFGNWSIVSGHWGSNAFETLLAPPGALFVIMMFERLPCFDIFSLTICCSDETSKNSPFNAPILHNLGHCYHSVLFLTGKVFVRFNTPYFTLSLSYFHFSYFTLLLSFFHFYYFTLSLLHFNFHFHSFTLTLSI